MNRFQLGMVGFVALVAIACKDTAPKSTPPSTPASPGGSASGPAQPATPFDAPPAKLSLAGVDVAEVAPTGYEPLTDTDRIVVAITTNGVVIDGKAIVAIAEGTIDVSQKPDGVTSMNIPKLGKFAASLGPQERVYIAMDRSLPYQILVEVLYSLKSEPAKWTKFDLVARSTGTLMSVPIELPTKAPPSATQPQPHPDQQPVQLFVSITDKALLVWSVSQLEGTLQRPKLEVPLDDAKRLDKLSAALAEIVKRRWPAKRPDVDREIVIQAPPRQKMQLIAELFGAVRETADKQPLFPEIRLATAFE